MRDCFVYSVCGDLHAARVNLSLKFLKRFSRKDIVVVASRLTTRINHDQVMLLDASDSLSLHESSIVQKTRLPFILKDRNNRFCYLDSDMMAVSREVDSIFRQHRGPACFSQDLVHLDEFSRYAVQCGCKSGKCAHLREALRAKFGVAVTGDWRHWNGGVFVFTEDAAELFRLWHEYVQQVFTDPYWRTRDQGALIAAAWNAGMQNLPILRAKFNHIVDGLCGRRWAATEDLRVDTSYTLTGAQPSRRPAFLHFINGTEGRRGWKNWDDAESFLAHNKNGNSNGTQRKSAASFTPVSRKSRLSDDNRRVHGMWIGTRLSKLEMLTLKSFVKHGHEFHLWLYDELEEPLPVGVIAEDATTILPRTAIFRKKDIDNECGVGRASYGAPFSDLFRYKLLYEHGGYWVDMDVTCLRPFDFKSPHLFRSHRIGVVGNIMKCPKHSRVMAETYEQVAAECNELSEWLMPNRVLTQKIAAHRLNKCVHQDICNEDSWWNVIKELIERDSPIPDSWHAIHWINEFWRTLQTENGVYRGKRMLDYIPEKNKPAPGSTLDRLYGEYDLADGLSNSTAPVNGRHTAPAVISKRQPAAPETSPRLHLNVLTPSMSLGGAERSIFDTLQSLSNFAATCDLFLFHRVVPSYPVHDLKHVKVNHLTGLSPEDQAARIALAVLSSGTPAIYTHMIPASFLRLLWKWNVTTIPVVQNSQPAWLDAPTEFDSPQVPFVVAVAEAVADELRQFGCSKPVVVLRHEVKPFLDEIQRRNSRAQIRGQYSISEDTLLIGMVGQFKSQKAYTRAVRVLAALREKRKAKLMILGGWNQDWGNGRAAYTAVCKLALDLNVMPDLIMPGAVGDARPYYSAFDVYLNTSVYEGLSVAILEAIQSCCPVVAADVGGNREALDSQSELVRDAWDTDAYVSAIQRVTQRGRDLTNPIVPDDALVPRLWCLLGRQAAEQGQDRNSRCTMIITDTLDDSAERHMLSVLLQRWPEKHSLLLCTLKEVQSERQLSAIESAGIRIFSVARLQSSISKAEQVCSLAQRLRATTIYLWSADPEFKLLIAKILGPSSVRLIDAPFGAELASSAALKAFQKRIALSAKEYHQRVERVMVNRPASRRLLENTHDKRYPVTAREILSRLDSNGKQKRIGIVAGKAVVRQFPEKRMSIEGVSLLQ